MVSVADDECIKVPDRGNWMEALVAIFRERADCWITLKERKMTDLVRVTR